MAFELNSLKTDAEREVEGVWHPLPGEGEIKVARHGNDRFNKLLRQLAKKHKLTLEAEDDLSFKVSEDLMIEVYAHTVLLDWRNITIDGTPTDYTPEIGMQALRVKDFRERVEQLARDAESYRVKNEAAIVKNS